VDAAAAGPSLPDAGAAEAAGPLAGVEAPWDEGVWAFKFAEQMRATNAKTKTNLIDSFTSKFLIQTPMTWRARPMGCQRTRSLPHREKFHKQILEEFLGVVGTAQGT